MSNYIFCKFQHFLMQNSSSAARGQTKSRQSFSLVGLSLHHLSGQEKQPFTTLKNNSVSIKVLATVLSDES